MFFYAFLLLSAYLILKPVRNSLFLVKFSADQLPLMYMVIAVVAAPIASAYGWVASRTTLPRLVGGTTLIIVLNLAIFWWLITQQFDWLVYVFYVWVSLFGIFTTSQFWLLANYVFDAREAKRLFAFIGAGAIAGGITGSVLTNMFAKLLGTENLLWLCVGFMILCFFILTIVWPKRAGGEQPRKQRSRGSDLKGMWPVIFKSRHLTLMTGIIAVTVMVSTFVDFQFNSVVQTAFDDKDELTAFFALFFTGLSVFSLLLQLLFSSRIIRRFGVGAALLFLPVGLLIGSSMIFLVPILASAVVVKLSDGSFRYSINRTGFELLYMPVPASIKSRVKALMDVVGDRFARGIGGALLYLVSSILSWTIGQISLLSAGLIGVWIILATMARREYSRTFRKAIDNRAIDTEQVRVELRDPEAMLTLIKELESQDVRRVLFALELTSQSPDDRLIEPLKNLLSHEDARVRVGALSQLNPLADSSLIRVVVEMVRDVDPDVRTEAIHFLAVHATEEHADSLRPIMDSTDPVVIAAAIRCALEHDMRDAIGDLASREKIDRLIQTEGDQGINARREVARALRYLKPDDTLTELIPHFLADQDPVVRRCGLISAAALQKREYLPIIVGYLEEPLLRGLAKDALLMYGPEIIEELKENQVDTHLALPIRLRIPKIVSLMDAEEAVAALLEHLDIEDVLVRYQVIKGLNRICKRMPNVVFDPIEIEDRLVSEAHHYYQLDQYRSAIADGDSTETKAINLLLTTLTDRQHLCIDQAFRFAGMTYPANDMYFAYQGVTSSSRLLQARAIEYLDTLWNRRQKEVLFPILEKSVAIGKHARELFSLKRLSFDQALREILNGTDQWLAACGVYVVREHKLHAFVDDVAPLAETRHMALCEIARVTTVELAEPRKG
jgi:AAA family ATP:ADP antiporter